MTTTYTTAITNIIKALPQWMKASIEINGTPDGWVPVYSLGLTTSEIRWAFVCDVVELDGLNLRFKEEDISIINNLLK